MSGAEEREYVVWSTYKVTGSAIVRAKSAAEAIEKSLNSTAEDRPEFYFSDPHGETKMRARWLRPADRTDPTGTAAGGEGSE